MDSQQRDELMALVRKAVAREVQRAAANQDVEQLTLDEAEANARIRERLTAVETELKIISLDRRLGVGSGSCSVALLAQVTTPN